MINYLSNQTNKSLKRNKYFNKKWQFWAQSNDLVQVRELMWPQEGKQGELTK